MQKNVLITDQNIAELQDIGEAIKLLQIYNCQLCKIYMAIQNETKKDKYIETIRKFIKINDEHTEIFNKIKIIIEENNKPTEFIEHTEHTEQQETLLLKLFNIIMRNQTKITEINKHCNVYISNDYLVNFMEIMHIIKQKLNHCSCANPNLKHSLVYCCVICTITTIFIVGGIIGAYFLLIN